MYYLRNLSLFCCILTVIGCSGLSKTAKKEEIKPENQIVKLTTSEGVMLIELYDKTPLHKKNFLKLVDTGFYDSLLFHRVISGFMIQGGDPNSKGAAAGAPLGMGGPGYTIPAEFDTALFHQKGALSAARMGDDVNPEKASSGSQFYIVQGKKYTKAQIDNLEKNMQNQEYMKGMHESREAAFSFTETQKKAYQEVGGTPFLDGGYTVFGQVIYGLDVIDKIAAVKTNRGDRPINDVYMTMEIVDRTKVPELNSSIKE